MARKITPSVGSLCSLLLAVTACGTASKSDGETAGSGGTDVAAGMAGTANGGSASAAGATGGAGSVTNAGGSANGGDTSGGAGTAGTSAGGASGGTDGMGAGAGQGPSGVSVLTNRYDNLRSGSNPRETVLSASNVNKDKFGLLYKRSVDGQMYSQPLYVHGLGFGNGVTRDVVFAATMHNSVYAFDVAGTEDKPIWSKSLGASGPVNGFGCTDMLQEVGSASTPVIDADAGIIFVVSKGQENGTWVQRVHALDLLTGAERPGSPVVIAATVNGTGDGSSGGKLSFNAETQLNRAGLLLDHGTVYMTFASHCDKSPYHGWILAYQYANNTLTQTKAFTINPNGKQGGIWQAGVGLSSDADGLYFAAGNGSTDPNSNPPDVSESVVRLGLPDLSIKDYWIPKNYGALNGADSDFSSGAILLPHDRVMTGSKDGRLYVLDRTNFTKYNAGGDKILQILVTPGKADGDRGHLHGGPIYYQIPGGAEWVYLWPEQGPLIGYQMDPTTHLLKTPETRANFFTPGHPGGMLALSSNGTAGSGVLWASVPQQDAWHDTQPGTLYAIDAADMSKVLWSSEQDKARDAVGNYAKFCPPVVADGHVFLSTFSGKLNVYGLLK